MTGIASGRLICTRMDGKQNGVITRPEILLACRSMPLRQHPDPDMSATLRTVVRHRLGTCAKEVCMYSPSSNEDCLTIVIVNQRDRTVSWTKKSVTSKRSVVTLTYFLDLFHGRRTDHLSGHGSVICIVGATHPDLVELRASSERRHPYPHAG